MSCYPAAQGSGGSPKGTTLGPMGKECILWPRHTRIETTSRLQYRLYKYMDPSDSVFLKHARASSQGIQGVPLAVFHDSGSH